MQKPSMIAVRAGSGYFSTADQLALAAMAAAAAALAIALISQYGFGWRPCPLCVWQRLPYAIGLALAGGSFLSPQIRGPFRALAGFVFLAGAGLAVFHSGVEFGWWRGLDSCSAPDPSGLSAQELLDQLSGVNAVRCDAREPFLFHLSMANWSFLASIAIGGALLSAARRAPDAMAGGGSV